jgi:hypothetical protein
MDTRYVASIVGAATIVAMTASFADGQDFKPPRTPDGKPNLTGVWQALNTAHWDLQDHSAHSSSAPGASAADGTPGGRGVVQGNQIPYLPSAIAQKRENFAKRMTLDPLHKCYLPGVPRIMYMPFPFHIFQTPTSIAIAFEYVHALRTIFTDGSKHPDGHIDWWMGDSRGHWEGDTLVVDVTHFGPETWFDRAGNYHSDALHLVERYTLISPDHINYQVTVEDAKVFSRPWTMSMVLYRLKEPYAEILEYECYALDDPASN